MICRTCQKRTSVSGKLEAGTAEHEFYLLQDEIGVGFFSDPQSPHGEYWAVYVAHQKEQEPYQGEIAKSKD